MIRLALPLAFLLVAGCSNTIADLSCDDVAKEAVRISNGAIIKIADRTLTSHDDKSIVCHGKGEYADGSGRLTRFREFIDGDGDKMIKYDTDEYQAGVVQRFNAESAREAAQAQQQYQQDVDQASAQIRSAMGQSGSSDAD